MKKALFVLVVLLVGGARADNIVTSREYVDTQANTLQFELPAKNENTVLLNTNTAGAPGEKAIYDSTAAFGVQTDALVTAGTFNTAVQNALESEFVCIERQNGNGGCLLYEIRSPTQQQILPSGYTRLEYLESTGTQFLNLGQPIGSGENITVKFAYTVDSASAWFGARDSNSLSAGFSFDSDTNRANTLYIIPHNVAKNRYSAYRVLDLELMVPYVLNWYGNPFRTPNLSSSKSFIRYGDIIDGSNYLVIPQYNAFLFTYNRAGTPGIKRSMRIYYFTVENKMHLIPARRDSDGELGMYDTVTNTFFTNRGTGTFIAGPVVSSNLYLPSGN